LDNSDFLFKLGRPISPLYSLAMSIRSFLYNKKILKSYSLSVPVISIGNLTMGGSGKTPVTMYLAKLLQKHGYRPAIISRGYGGKAKGQINIVSNFDEVFLNPEQAGDEPFMLATSLQGVPVVTGKSRVHPCRYAIDTLKCDILLLDDGFQHLSVNRDIDIVLFNATTLAGNSRVFPAGVLREPVTALKRCQAFVLTGVDENNTERTTAFSSLLQTKFPDKPVFCAPISQYSVRSAESKTLISKGSSLGKVFTFCAIANPIRFKNSLDSIGIDRVGFKTYKDHGKYSQNTMDTLCEIAIQKGATCLLTTQKDYVKIMDLTTSLPLHILEIDLELPPSFGQFLFERLNCSNIQHIV